jgi:tripartite-type tricarboxylate transporter receptor subunit TctC
MTRISRRSFNFGVSTTAIGAVLGAPSIGRAQDYPSQDVHFICAFPAGSGADVIVRWYAEKLRPIMGQTIIVENKVGAMANVATEYVARAKPDGYNIFVHGWSAIASQPYVFKNPNIDATKTLKLVATMNKQPMMLVVDAKSPFKSLSELTAHVKAKKEKATFGTSNILAKVMGAIYKEHMKLESVEVIYRTAGDSLNDLASGTLDYGVFDNIFAASQERAGRVRILAVSTGDRMKSTPNIPTMTEQGIPMAVTGGFGAMVPAETPRPVVDKLNRMFNQLTASEDAKKFFNNIASDPWVTTVEQSEAFLQSEIKNWADWVKAAKIEPLG